MQQELSKKAELAHLKKVAFFVTFAIDDERYSVDYGSLVVVRCVDYLNILYCSPFDF
jgi:hypothetical protein